MSDSQIEAPFTPLWARKFKDTRFFIYHGSSMSSLFRPGDLLCVQKRILANIRLGDIIIINWGNDRNQIEYVVHRVVSVKSEYLITQGDNNFKPDSQVVTMDTLVGLVTSFGRQNHVYSVKGGMIGLFYALFIHARNYLWWFLKRLGWRSYRLLRQSGWVNRIWQPAIRCICVMTDKGPLIKYCHGSRTVAHWWPEVKKFTVVKPFDLVIPSPLEENKFS